MSWSNHWVKVELDIPEEVQKANQQVICKSSFAARWEGAKSAVEFDPSCEAMVYHIDGTPLHGMSIQSDLSL